MKKIDNILSYDPGRHIFPDDAFYGDFFDIFNVKIDSSLKDISIFLEDVLHLETRLFSIFILFILSKVGYRQEWVYEENKEENDERQKILTDLLDDLCDRHSFENSIELTILALRLLATELDKQEIIGLIKPKPA